MIVLSLENSDRLLWLGRYSERVYTGLRSFAERFDATRGIKSKEEFAKTYCFDKNNSTSIYSGLLSAYDNAVVLRDEIGSETFSYIQLALYEMERAEKSQAPLLNLQKVIDNIAAFWGMADDIIEDERVRGIIKTGKRIERVDLYARMKAGNDDIRREIRRLTYRIEKTGKTGLKFNVESLKKLNELAKEADINHQAVLKEVESLIQ